MPSGSRDRLSHAGFSRVVRDYDVVLDSVGGETLDKSLQVLKPGGIFQYHESFVRKALSFLAS